jgi:hypothetical protein
LLRAAERRPGVPVVEGYDLDIACMAWPVAEETQHDLLLHYGSNVAPYPASQARFRRYRPSRLAVRGGMTPPQISPARKPTGKTCWTQVQLLDAGHFALESHHREIAARIRNFLGRYLERQ